MNGIHPALHFSKIKRVTFYVKTESCIIFQAEPQICRIQTFGILLKTACEVWVSHKFAIVSLCYKYMV